MTYERWLSVDEIADHLGIKRDTVYLWLRSKGMPGHKLGRYWRFRQAEVDEWVVRGEASDQTKRTKSKRGVDA